MKNIFIALFLLLFSNITVSQNTIDEKVTGNWIVKRIVKSNNNPNLKEITDSFATDTFKFMNDHSFLMTSKSNSKLFKMMANMTNGKNGLQKTILLSILGQKVIIITL